MILICFSLCFSPFTVSLFQYFFLVYIKSVLLIKKKNKKFLPPSFCYTTKNSQICFFVKIKTKWKRNEKIICNSYNLYRNGKIVRILCSIFQIHFSYKNTFHALVICIDNNFRVSSVYPSSSQCRLIFLFFFFLIFRFSKLSKTIYNREFEVSPDPQTFHYFRQSKKSILPLTK